jgi:hypothetical protein
LALLSQGARLLMRNFWMPHEARKMLRAARGYTAAPISTMADGGAHAA